MAYADVNSPTVVDFKRIRLNFVLSSMLTDGICGPCCKVTSLSLTDLHE